ncbi:MAG TPA: guanylate kinase, partial [Myxococcales bacterium]|nr:guanylate kinase [Myxococcales bacterium]
MSESKGSVIVVSAPSGAGKTTVLARVLAEMPGLRFSVSHTTRAPRDGERDGCDYHFVDRPTFERLRDRGELLEWAEVHGNLYGTAMAEIARAQRDRTDLLLDVDVQGAAQVRARVEAAVTVFILPPSFEVLEQRLRGRGQ